MLLKLSLATKQQWHLDRAMISDTYLNFAHWWFLQRKAVKVTSGEPLQWLNAIKCPPVSFIRPCPLNILSPPLLPLALLIFFFFFWTSGWTRVDHYGLLTVLSKFSQFFLTKRQSLYFQHAHSYVFPIFLLSTQSRNILNGFVLCGY